MCTLRQDSQDQWRLRAADINGVLYFAHFQVLSYLTALFSPLHDTVDPRSLPRHSFASNAYPNDAIQCTLLHLRYHYTPFSRVCIG